MLGAILFQQAFDLTDEETVSQMAFNLQWHYALDIPEESDAIKYLSAKTLWSMRNIVTDNDLDTLLFEQITDTLAKVFKVDTTKQRMDSVHIKSNMRRLGRIVGDTESGPKRDIWGQVIAGIRTDHCLDFPA